MRTSQVPIRYSKYLQGLLMTVPNYTHGKILYPCSYLSDIGQVSDTHRVLHQWLNRLSSWERQT